MATELIINASLPETRIALMEDGEIQELLIERASGKGIVGNIYKGRVTRVLPGMQAAFVDIGLEKAAFLYVDDVYVHSEIWEEEEGAPEASEAEEVKAGAAEQDPQSAAPVESDAQSGAGENTAAAPQSTAPAADDLTDEEIAKSHLQEDDEEEDGEDDVRGGHLQENDDDEEDDEDDEPAEMGPGGEGDGEGGGGGDQPSGIVAPPSGGESGGESGGGAEGGSGAEAGPAGEGAAGDRGPRRRHRRGRRGGRFRKRERGEKGQQGEAVQAGATPVSGESMPDSYQENISDFADTTSDRSELVGESQAAGGAEGPETNRPVAAEGGERKEVIIAPVGKVRPEFKEQRGRDRRIRSKQGAKPVRAQANIQDLLKEGQEVIVQVAKDPIATKGARLTCHLSLPGRHLVCMPTIDHVGVSRRIERDDERRRLRDFVERNRPKNLGFIVRTASGKQSEKRVKQDIDYLTRLWGEIKEKAGTVTAPALVYEDLNSVLRAIRDWVNEEIDKIVVDSRYHFNEIQRFVSHFMPQIRNKIELYHGDIPIFDAYNISTELARALERKVWLKSGGYIVVDQAEALVAIDVNTGRYVGKKNLEDTILKTNLEAVKEIAYQLRLRNCGGIIILDLIDMEKEENKQRVYRALEEELKKDRARPTILKISELGLIEMTRKRTRDTIVRSLCESCVQCEGKGFIKSKQTVAYEAMREIEREGIERESTKILVQANPDVIDILAIEERESLDQLERRYRKQIYLQAVTDYHPEQFEVAGDKRTTKAADEFNEPRRNRERRRERERESAKEREKERERGDRGERQGQGRDRGRDRSRDQGGGAPKLPARQIVLPSQASGAQPAIIIAPAQAAGAMNGAEYSNGTANGAANETSNGIHAGLPNPPELHDGFTEEDRLAFLRAQAAQDAALARLGVAPGVPGAAGRPIPAGGDRDRGGVDKRGRRGRRSRRGGKFRGKDRPERSAGPGTAPVIIPRGEGPQGGGNGGSGGGGGSEGGGGGGGGETPPSA